MCSTMSTRSTPASTHERVYARSPPPVIALSVARRAILPIALNRKNALFAGSDRGGEHWAVIASLIETCKLNDVDPQAWLPDALTRIVNGHLNSRIDELLPWARRANQAIAEVA